MKWSALGVLVWVGLVVASCASVARDGKDAAVARDPLAGFQSTGETRRCVHTYEIRDTRVLDDSMVLFRLRVRDFYVNRLPHPCPGLKIRGSFSYKVQGAPELCRGDVIRVLETGGTGAACMLGEFEKLNEKPQ